MSELKRDMYRNDEGYIEALEEQLRAMRERFDVDDPIFTEHFIKKSIIRPPNSDGKIVNHHKEDEYYYLAPLTPRAGEGLSAGLNVGPISRLAEHGFIILSVDALDNVGGPDNKHQIKDRCHPTANK